MKTPLFFLIFLFFSSLNTWSQSLMVLNAEDKSDVSNETIVRNVDMAETTVVVGAFIKNISGESRDVMVKKYTIDLVSGSIAYFCWDGCYGNTVNVSANYLTVAPGDTIKVFSGDFKHNGFIGTSIIKYTFFVDRQITDSVSVNIEYNVSATGIYDLKNLYEISSAYPNPASSSVFFDYTISANTNGNIIFYDIIGKKIKEIVVDKHENQIRIDVSDISKGLYIWTFEVDGIKIKSEKLLLK